MIYDTMTCYAGTQTTTAQCLPQYQTDSRTSCQNFQTACSRHTRLYECIALYKNGTSTLVTWNVVDSQTFRAVTSSSTPDSAMSPALSEVCCAVTGNDWQA